MLVPHMSNYAHNQLILSDSWKPFDTLKSLNNHMPLIDHCYDVK